MRNPLLIKDCTDVFEGSDFKIFSNLIEKKYKVKGIVVSNTADKPRSFFDKLNNWAREEGAAGLGYITYADDEHKGPIAKNLDDERLKQFKLKENESILFVCNNQTEQRCLQGLLGSPSKDFKKMKDTIADDTMLFLFNFSSKKLFGPFHKHGKIQMNIDPVAWTRFKQGKKQPPPKKKKSRFPAQVRIKSWASKNNFLTSATPFRITDVRVIPKGGGAIMRNTISTPLKVLLDSQKRAAETEPDSMVLLKKQQSNKHDAKESV